MKLGDQVVRVRSKNAGPFWVTIDVFCGEPAMLDRVLAEFPASRIAEIYSQPEAAVRLFEIRDLSVLKISFPREIVQGGRLDRDMHGAQYAHLLSEAELAA